MKEVSKIFSYENNKIAVVLLDGQIWFRLVDIANALDYSRTEKVTNLLDDDEKLMHQYGESGQKRDTWFTSESGLYNLILKSTKSEAKVFRKWVTAEILPSIRKAGSYTTDDARNYHEKLSVYVADLENLKSEKDDLQKQLNTKKKQIELQTNAMLLFIKEDQNQIKIEFIE